MQPLEHPDHLLHQQQARAITRGSRQAADTAAMEAMFDALDSGVGREEANQIFFTDLYKRIAWQ